MIHRPHTNGEEITLEQEFEWVNAWAESTRSASAPAEVSVAKDRARSSPSETPRAETPRAETPLHGKAPADAEMPQRAETRARMKVPETADAAKLHVRSMQLVSALDPDPAVPAANTAAPEQPADQVNPGFVRIDGVESLDSSPDALSQGSENGHRRTRWSDLFRLVTRTPNQRRDDSADADAARDLFVLDAAPATSLDDVQVTASPPAQATAPDQLALDVAEIEIVRDKLLARPLAHDAPLGTIAPVRTSDAVPILVGVVLALTSMIVFAVAASFVSLR
jgi:hypothetical protein